MNFQQEELKEKLVEAGFWDADAQRDQTNNWAALEEVTEKIQRRLAEAACLFICPLKSSKQSYQVILSYDGDADLVIGLGKDIYEAIYSAALSLPGLLADHPEYAATNP